MGCDCAALRVELLSQRDIMVRWFEMLLSKVQLVEEQSSDIMSQLQSFKMQNLSEATLPESDRSALNIPSIDIQQKNNSRHFNYLADDCTEKKRHEQNSTVVNVPITVSTTETRPITTETISQPNTAGSEKQQRSVKDAHLLEPKIEQEDVIFCDEQNSADTYTFGESSGHSASAALFEGGISVSTEDALVDQSFMNNGDEQGPSMILDSGLITHQTASNTIQYVKQKEKIYKCTQCNYQTWRKAYLTDHSLIHSGEKPFSCDLCSYRCRLKIHLRSHKRFIHSTEKPFQCESCDYRSPSKSNVRAHWKRFHLKEPQVYKDT